MIDISGPREDDVPLDAEDEAERLRQEEKAEKVKWMKANAHLRPDEEEEEEDSQKLFLEDSQFFKLGKATLKKIQNSCSLSFLDSSANSSSCSQSQSQLLKLSSGDIESQTSVGGGSKSKLTSQSFFASPDNPLLKVHPTL